MRLDHVPEAATKEESYALFCKGHHLQQDNPVAKLMFALASGVSDEERWQELYSFDKSRETNALTPWPNPLLRWYAQLDINGFPPPANDVQKQMQDERYGASDQSTPTA